MLKLNRAFATLVKKPQMELTLRTPYKTLFKNFVDFRFIKTKTAESVIVISNRMPPALYMLPPGQMSVKPVNETKDFKGDFIHMGGWLTIHADNTVEGFLLDAVEVKDFNPTKNEQLSPLAGEDSVSISYIESLRREAHNAFFKSAA